MLLIKVTLPPLSKMTLQPWRWGPGFVLSNLGILETELFGSGCVGEGNFVSLKI